MKVALKVSFEDIRSPHFYENVNAYNELKKLGWFTDEELQKMFEEQMALDKLEEGDADVEDN